MKKNKIYIYRTEEFNKKEKELKFSLDEASDIYSKFILENKKEKEDFFCRLDIIYGDNYIFKENWEPYSLMTGTYNLSGIWVNGNTGKVEDIETDKNVKILLEPGKHIPYTKKIITP